MGFFSKLFGSEWKVGELEAATLVKGGARLLDVRTAAERKSQPLKKSAHIPVHELSSRSKELNMKHPIVAVCAHGPRARRAASVLRKEGFEAYWLAGGVSSWNATQ
ncbi:rhodanese-like domain-containing protein [Corynebacterium sp. H78]|uniref:rhodanese-like domain-containing protein n=1 Tax=Corynebacterium sp. H78 TaxID=3133417 RepID=UPI0030B2E036